MANTLSTTGLNIDTGSAVVPTPTNSTHATTKAYVDNLTSASNTLTQIKTVDGLGSGLEADTVPGYGIGTTKTLTTGTDLNTILVNGIYAVVNPTQTNLSGDVPSLPAGSYSVTVERVTDTMITQRAVNPLSFIEYIRFLYFGSNWYGWYRVWNSGSDGPGSGLDADTVSGYGIGVEAPVSKTAAELDAGLPGGFYRVDSPTGLPAEAHNVLVMPLSTAYQKQIATSYIRENVYIRNVEADVPGPWVEIWNANTDGPGSGLDADTVSGYGIGVSTNASTETNLNNYKTGGIFLTPDSGSMANVPSGIGGGGRLLIIVGSGGGGSYVTQYIVNVGSSTFKAMLRAFNGTSWVDDGNGGQPPAPKPSSSPAGGANAVGQSISGVSTSAVTIPGTSGSLWDFYVISHVIATNVIVSSESFFGQAAGGAILSCASGNRIIYRLVRV